MEKSSTLALGSVFALLFEGAVLEMATVSKMGFWVQY